jgi:hypothetical protein
MVLRTVIRSHDYFRLRAVRDSTSGDNDFVVRAISVDLRIRPQMFRPLSRRRLGEGGSAYLAGMLHLAVEVRRSRCGESR